MSRKRPNNPHSRLQANPTSAANVVPRPFLPPSYYAAAGGIPYPRKSTNQTLPFKSTPTSTPTPTGVDREPDRSSKRTRQTNPDPPSSASESSFQSRLKGPQARAYGDNRKSSSTLASQAPPSSDPSGSGKWHGLSPDFEADLLPSLQSTIHRMTRPPSRVLADSTNLGGEGYGYEHQYEREGLKRRPTMAPISARSGGSSSMEAQAHSQGQAQGSTPRSRIPQKSALKSALRTPIQKMEPAFAESVQTPAPAPSASLATPTPGPTPSTPRSPSRNSLRSVKSLLSRKLGGSNQQNATPSPAMPSTQPKHEQTTDYFSNQPTPASHLPRPKTRQEYQSQQCTPAYTSQTTATATDESDFENKYERQWMERRRLTVANAEVVPSGSSSSDSSMSSFDNLPTPRPGQYISHKAPQPQRKFTLNSNAGAKPGLGFDMYQNNHDRFSSATAPNSPLLPNMEFPEKDRAKILRFSLPPSGSDASLYSNHQLSYPGSWDTENENEYSEHEEYRVSVQSATSTASSNPPRRVPVPREDVNKAYWEDGLSGSGSEEFQSGGDYHNQGQSRFDRNGGRRGWEEDSTRPLSGNYPRPPSSQPVPRITPQRGDQREYRERPSPAPATRPASIRPSIPEQRSKSPVTPKPTQPNAAHTWFNESSGSFEADEIDHIPSTPQRKAPLPPGFEAASLSQEWKRQAAQQREAFGLPPSVSDEDNLDGRGARRWSESDSYRSSVASTRWEWGGEEEEGSGGGEDEALSSSAENMIKALHPEWTRNMPIMSAASSATSFYGDQNDNFETATEDTPLNTSSESPPPPPNPHFSAAGRQKHSSRDPRDEIILEFLRSEEIFLSNTQICIDTFIIPIRTENSRSWIGGVPTNVSRLLDWFEDIANLHLAVYQSLESSAAMQEGDGASAGLAGYLYDLVGKLHVYQPYLVSLADVLEEVAALVGNGRSDFGEFIRIQEKEVETAGWTFEQLLMEPVNRLAVYQDLFSDLLEVTPQDHPEFLATMLLSRSADTVMRVMTEVKVRETEHRLIQSLAAQLEDSAMAKLLCSRERRLLHSGTLRLVSPSVNLSPPVSQPLSHQAKAQKRSSKLVQAITNWDRKPERSNSLKSIASSVRSFSTTSSFSNGPPPPPSRDNSRSSRLPLLKGLFKGKPASVITAPPPSGMAAILSEAPPDCVQVFVFSDMVLLVLPKPTTGSKYSLVPKLGLAKVFSVLSEREGSVNELRIQMIPTNINSMENDTLPRAASITTLVFDILPTGLDVTGPYSGQAEERCRAWNLAFEKSAQDTAQLLSCPGPRKAVPSERSKVTWLAVSSLIASGLPLPRSASGQLPDLEYGRVDEEAKKLEREERGWWSLRYQQVLGEYVHPSPRGAQVHDEDKNFV